MVGETRYAVPVSDDANVGAGYESLRSRKFARFIPRQIRRMPVACAVRTSLHAFRLFFTSPLYFSLFMTDDGMLFAFPCIQLGVRTGSPWDVR